MLLLLYSYYIIITLLLHYYIINYFFLKKKVIQKKIKVFRMPIPSIYFGCLRVISSYPQHPFLVIYLPSHFVPFFPSFFGVFFLIFIFFCFHWDNVFTIFSCIFLRTSAQDICFDLSTSEFSVSIFVSS